MSIHLFNDYFYVDVLKDLLPLIKHLGITPREVDITLLDISKLSGVDMSSHRFNLADTKWPIIIYENGSLVDGRHRLRKIITGGSKTVQAYVINPSLCDKVKKRRCNNELG